MTVAVSLSLTALYFFLSTEMAILQAIDLRALMVCSPDVVERSIMHLRR